MGRSRTLVRAAAVTTASAERGAVRKRSGGSLQMSSILYSVLGFITRPPLRDGVACAGRLARAVLSWEMAFAMLNSYDWNYSGSDCKDNAWACQVL